MASPMTVEFQTNPDLCNDFFELMEDTVAYFTEEYGISAELAYSMTEGFAQVKIAKLREIKEALDSEQSN